MKLGQMIIGLGCLMLALSACSRSKKLSYADYPVHVYEQPYDLIYKRTMDVLGAQPGWVLAPSDKNEGIIRLQGTTYSNILDMDTETAQFVVKYVNKKQTSVEFDPEHSACRNNRCRSMLEQIDKVLKELPPHIELPKEPAQQ